MELISVGGAIDRIRILIADDFIPVQESTHQLLEQEPDFQVVTEANGRDVTMNLAKGRS